MSAATKKHHPKSQRRSSDLRLANGILLIHYNEKEYHIPMRIMAKYQVNVLQKGMAADDSVSSDEIFAELNKKYPKASNLLKGVRYREGSNQSEFAQRINVTQANLSKMENGKRPIGKEIAKRIAKIFGVNYRYFLE